MNSNTHIFVLRIKEIIYTLLFLIFAAILILLLIFMFRNKSHVETMSQNISETPVLYNPGVYTSSVILGQYAMDVVVTVDENQLKRVELHYLDDAVETMYPLLKTGTQYINEQLASGTSPEHIQGDVHNQHTLQVLISSINHALEKALE